MSTPLSDHWSGPSATPILLQIYNLHPQIHIHLSNLICVGIIPNHPKHMGSFLAPFDQEHVLLAFGVQTLDSLNQCHFDLHAYVILEHGNLLTIAKMLGMKGVNGHSPCRSCKTKGVHDITRQSKTYYIPLWTPDTPHQTRPHADPHDCLF